MDILRIAALGTAGVLLGITVKGAKPEFADLQPACRKTAISFLPASFNTEALFQLC